jgi:hypothetical protein
MKKLVTVQDVDGEGLTAFLGKRILVVAQSYFYAGTLTGVNSTCILLEDALFVLETGDFAKRGFDAAEKIPGGKCYVQTSSIEAFFESKE